MSQVNPNYDTLENAPSLTGAEIIPCKCGCWDYKTTLNDIKSFILIGTANDPNRDMGTF
jgi:hypothetical protein